MSCASRFLFETESLQSITHASIICRMQSMINLVSRKDPQYIFFLMWQNEMRELAAGVYNLMKSSRTALEAGLPTLSLMFS